MASERDIELLRKLREMIEKEEGLDTNAGLPTTLGEGDQPQVQEEVDDRNSPPAANNALVGFILHCLFKVAVVMLFLFRGIFSTIINGLVANQVMAVFAVFDFWMTKNVTGKRLLGLRWFFNVDQWGTQKFFFECRANDDYTSFIWSKLFWIVQLVYTFLPFVAIVGGFIQAFYVLVNFEMIVVSLGLMLAGGSNLFFFFQASNAARLKQKELKRKLSKAEQIKDLGFATIYSYA